MTRLINVENKIQPVAQEVFDASECGIGPYKGSKVECKLFYNSDTGDTQAQLCLNTGYVFLSFTVGYYPSCCALRMFHTFTYYDRYFPSEEKFHELMAFIMSEIGVQTNAEASRLQVMLVESRSGWYRTDANSRYVDRTFDEVPVLPYEEVVKNIKYPWFFSYFNKRKACKDKMMWNKNTGNIIHELEVVYANPLFKD